MDKILEAIGKVVTKIDWRAVGTVCICLIGGATVVKGIADNQAKQQMIDASVARQLSDAISKAAKAHHH